MQLGEGLLYNGQDRHNDAEKDGISEHRKYPLGKPSFGGGKEDHILTCQREDKACQELQHPVV